MHNPFVTIAMHAHEDRYDWPDMNLCGTKSIDIRAWHHAGSSHYMSGRRSRTACPCPVVTCPAPCARSGHFQRPNPNLHPLHLANVPFLHGVHVLEITVLLVWFMSSAC
jgi:hypothetical protein